MIFWRGYGFLVVLYAGVGFIAGAVLSSSAGGSWPVGFCLLLAAAANFFTAKKLGSKTKILIDPETEQEVILERGDSLFFIPMMYWTYVIAGFAVLILLDLG